MADNRRKKRQKSQQGFIQKDNQLATSGEVVEKKPVESNNPNDPYKKYKDFKWENPDQFRNGPI